MSVVGQFSRVCKPYPLHEEITRELLDETDIEKFFITTFLRKREPSVKMPDLPKVPEKFWRIGLVKFCNSEAEQRFFLQKQKKISKKEISCSLDQLCNFLELFD